MDYEIDFFESRRSERLVQSFILKQSNELQSKVACKIDLLSEYGKLLFYPHCKSITRELYELRLLGKEQVRIFYCFKDNKIILLHAFKKKSQKLPRKEIAIAQKRLDSI